MNDAVQWRKLDELPEEGRVRTAAVDGRTTALSRCGGRLGAPDNHCPHQGGPLGEGSIENGWLRCPLVETLVAWGVDTVFGMVGHSSLGFADALRGAEERGEIRYIGIRHEDAASSWPPSGTSCARRPSVSPGRRTGVPPLVAWRP